MLHVFIINSFSGKVGLPDKIRSELEKKTDFEYLVFNCEYDGHEKVLAAQIYDLFADEQIRFYACGDSGTFRNVLMALPDYNRAEFAEVPYINPNDFQEVFGERAKDFLELDKLIHGSVKELDYIDTNLGPAHNTISTGFDVKLLGISKMLAELPFRLGRSKYFVAGVMALFARTSVKTKVIIDGNIFNGVYDQIILANGKILGGQFHVGDENDPADGYMNVTMFPRHNFFIKVGYFTMLLTGNLKQVKRRCICLKAKKVKIYCTDGKNFSGNYDGELVQGDFLFANVVRHGIKYVVPQGFDTEEQE